MNPDPVAPSLMARVVGVLYVFGAFLVWLSLALPHTAVADERTMYVLVGLAVVSGCALLIGAPRARVWTIHLAIAAGSALICVAIYLSGVASGVYATMFVWVVLLSAYFFPGRAATAHLLWLLGAYCATLALLPNFGYSNVTRWLLVALALAMASAATSWLVARGNRLKRRLGRFFAVSLDMLCTANAEGQFLEVNEAWTRTLGYSTDELVSRPYVEFVHPDDRERTNDQTRLLAEGHDSVDFENRYRAKDGSWHWLRWSATLDAAEGVVYARATDVTRLKRLERERERLLEEVRSQARTDSLTGIPNRRWMEAELGRAIAQSVRKGFPLCLALLDLDRFKAYNDEHGHPAGDRLLCAVAGSWRDALRVSDFLARYGGEEFVVLLPEADLQQAMAVVERMRALTPGGQTASAGVAQWDASMTMDDLVSRADRALYRAKAEGRDRVVLDTPEPAAAAGDATATP